MLKIEDSQSPIVLYPSFYDNIQKLMIGLLNCVCADILIRLLMIRAGK
jgi:hypothetical protein